MNSPNVARSRIVPRPCLKATAQGTIEENRPSEPRQSRKEIICRALRKSYRGDAQGTCNRSRVEELALLLRKHHATTDAVLRFSEEVDHLADHYTASGAFQFDQVRRIRNRLLLSVSIPRRRFIEICVRRGCYASPNAAGRAYDQGSMPDDCLWELLEEIKFPTRFLERFHLPQRAVFRMIASAIANNAWGDTGEWLRPKKTPGKRPSETEIAIAKAIVTENGPFLEPWVRASWRLRKTQLAPQDDPQTVQLIRQIVDQSTRPLRDTSHMRWRLDDPRWIPYTVKAFNRYQLAVYSALPLVEELVQGNDYVKGPIGKLFQPSFRSPFRRVENIPALV